MKKFLLCLLIIILLGGCGLGGWYFLKTNGKDSPIVGLTLEIANSAKIIWLDDYSATYKTEILGNQTESEYLADEQESLYNEITIQKFSFLNNGKVEARKKNSTNITTYYYISNPNGDNIRIYEDENFTCEFKINYRNVVIYKDAEGYWIPINNIPHDYENRGYVVFKLNEVK